MSDLTKTREIFEDWIFIMDDALGDFFDMIPPEINDQLDFSVSSLDILEKYMMDNFAPDDMEKKENKLWLDGFARYIGETFRKNLPGSDWNIDLDDPNDIYYGLPILTGAKNQVVAYCPHQETIVTLNRKKGTYLSSLLIKAINLKPF